jgi:hypothetical protein
MNLTRHVIVLMLSVAFCANMNFTASAAGSEVPTIIDCTRACEASNERVGSFRIEGRNAHCVCECKPGWARKSPETACKRLKVTDLSFVYARKVNGDFVCPPDHPQYHFAPLRNGHPDANTCWAADVVPCQSINRVWSCQAGKACGDPEAGPNGQTADSNRECR